MCGSVRKLSSQPAFATRFAHLHAAFVWLHLQELGIGRREQDDTRAASAPPIDTRAMSVIGSVLRSQRPSTARWPPARNAGASPAIDFSF